MMCSLVGLTVYGIACSVVGLACGFFAAMKGFKKGLNDAIRKKDGC